VGDDVDWRVPLQLFAGLHFLVLSGRASWDGIASALHDEEPFLRDWLGRERVQTNEVARCWWLVPCFLEVARRTSFHAFDCVELGCSAGLNLIWDRYGYVYANGCWGRDTGPLLGGEERGTVPPRLLARRPVVRSRVGVDAAPPDLRTDDGVRYLKSFVWAGREDRLERVDRAVDVWRRDPPEIRVGDMVDELPSLLARRRDDALLLVWQTAALNYLPRDRQEQLRGLLAQAGEDGPLAFVETWQPLDGSHDHYGLFMQTWPAGERIEVGHAEFHGAWLDWRLR
jgi:hypothetical protein